MTIETIFRWGRGAAAAGLVLGGTSCTVLLAPDERSADVPESYRFPADGAAFENDWWRAFGDGQLNRLMDQALSGNLTIEQAAARLRQAEAVAVKSGAGRFPSLSGSAAAATKYTGAAGQATQTADSFSLGMAASYELDLWGRVASTRRSALADLDASRWNLQSAAMTVAAQTATAYFDWLSLHARLQLLEKQLETNRQMLSVVEKRFQTAKADALDVLQRRQQLLAGEAALPPVRAELDAASTRLALLVGLAPQADLELEIQPLPQLPGVPAAGIPSDLLTRRPDVQAAWARLEAADWNVSAARAARMPAVSLTGSAAYGSGSTDDLFDNWIMNLAAGLSMPLIDGGSRRAEVRRSRALSDERLAAYRETVLAALGEVEDALSEELHQSDYLRLLTAQLAAAEQTEREAFRRYTRGLESYFEALSAQTARQSLELNLIAAGNRQLAVRVGLYRALGGDWTGFVYPDGLQREKK